MAKLISVFRANHELSAEAFDDYWRNNYLRPILALDCADKITKVVYNRIVPNDLRTDGDIREIDWTGVAETFFNSEEDAEAFLASAAVRSAAKDANKITTVFQLLCRDSERWNNGGGKPILKALMFFKRNIALSREEAHRYWRVDHVRVGNELGLAQKLQRYVQNFAVRVYDDVDGSHNFDGAPEFWLETQEEASSLFTDPEKMAVLREDEAKFADPHSIITLILDETVVYERP